MPGPLHLKAPRFCGSGLFSGLEAFAELEARIGALPSEQERGEAFEVFAEAYFATQPILQARQVWPQEALPAKQRDLLALTARDMGVDGIIETTLGEFHAYQVKFRSGRAPLAWQELSTFMGLSDRASQRVLFTNSNDLPALMDDRTGFYCIRGADLDRLEARDLEAMQAWLERGEARMPRKVPLPHQEEALEQILAALKIHDRATAVMACGSGKTLVALWTAERMGCQSVLVLVPSLALLRQTLHEWLRETSWSSLSYLCVCSDSSVAKGLDDLIVRQADLDFPVTTEPQAVRHFLETPFEGVRIVFSTYQSAQVVAEGMKNVLAFDLGIFDEAHKTAGRENARFGFALNDDNLPIRKRLFLTATPRHYDVRKKDKEGDARLVYSMDAREVYGPVAHTLTFADAARRDIICGYKVVISVVTSEMVNEVILRHGEVIVEGDPVQARQVAHQVAIQKGVERFGVAKLFTFHSTVTSARSFVAGDGEGIGFHLPAFQAFHVNGEMRTSERDNLMKEFRRASNAVMSNARCLTEGVDVPTIDLVAFLSPKKSKVDIVQAVGRAMRKSAGKEFGYVLLPLFLDKSKGESLEAALERGGFSDLWDVLGALQEQDEVLADIIRAMREECGRTSGFDDQEFREKVEVLGPALTLDSLRRAITAECVENLGLSWDEMFGALVAYKERQNHCNVPSRWPDNPSLASWVKNQRGGKKNGHLSTDRIRRLEDLGFVWDTFDSAWEEMFGALVAFKKSEHHCDVPRGWPDNPSLATWVQHQRSGKRTGLLSVDRITRLENLGFVWDPLDSNWEEMVEALAAFKEMERHCDVPAIWPDNPSLGIWASNQKAAKKKGRLSADRITRLENLGFVWDLLDLAWEEMFAALVAFKKKEDHCNVPEGWPDNPSLAKWVQHQRSGKRKGLLSVDRITRLENLSFDWDPGDSNWEEMFGALVAFEEREHHCNVPNRWPDNPSLGKWVCRQRKAKEKGQLGTERIIRLENLGFVWDPLGSAWEEMFRALVAFEVKEHHCNVPKKWADNPALGSWVNYQRRANKNGQLGADRITRLENLGFVWDPIDSAWEEMFRGLVAFKEKEHHCNLPKKWPDNPSLGGWVGTQRMAKKKGQLSTDRVSRLENLGFVWDQLDSNWEGMFMALEAFEEREQHCNVPAVWTDNPSLGSWVCKQRSAKRKGQLSTDRINRLENLGFVWDPLDSNWEEMFGALAAFRENENHCNVPKRWLDNPSLGLWVGYQRRVKKMGQLSNDRLAKLEALGFSWTTEREM